MIVLVLWGVLGVSLLLCALIGVVLCVLSVAYVFALKNNKPDHYDTDFFEAVLVEAGVVELAFGPRMRRPVNPFVAGLPEGGRHDDAVPRRERNASPRARSGASRTFLSAPVRRPETRESEAARATRTSPDEKDATVSLSAYEKVQTELLMVQDELEDALAERGED
jgi:hypothetical protein